MQGISQTKKSRKRRMKMKKIIRMALVVLAVLAIYSIGYEMGRRYGKLESKFDRLEEREKELDIKLKEHRQWDKERLDKISEEL